MSEMNQNISERWLSVDEIAAYLGINPGTVYKWIKRKSMPAKKVGSLWKFKKDQVDKWVENGGTNTSTSADTGAKKDE